MPWNRERYPDNWEELARTCKELAGWRCEDCGVADGVWRTSHKSKRLCKVHLQAAHLDHDPWNPNPRLAALCEICHDRYDHSMRRAQQIRTKRRKQHEIKIAAGQLELFLELKAALYDE